MANEKLQLHLTHKLYNLPKLQWCDNKNRMVLAISLSMAMVDIPRIDLLNIDIESENNMIDVLLNHFCWRRLHTVLTEIVRAVDSGSCVAADNYAFYIYPVELSKKLKALSKPKYQAKVDEVREKIGGLVEQSTFNAMIDAMYEGQASLTPEQALAEGYIDAFEVFSCSWGHVYFIKWSD